MAKDFKDAIKSSAKTTTLVDDNYESQAAQLIRSADAVLGIQDKQDNKVKKSKREAKTIRQTFTIGKEDILLINEIIRKFAFTGEVVNKSEIIRIGLQLIKELNEPQLLEILQKLERRTTGGWL